MKLDHVDVAIINSLMQDGRKSFRQIAKESKVSTPTVEARYNKLKKSGIIKNIEPIFNIEKIGNHLSALIYVKANLSQLIDIIDNFYSLSQVKSVYTVTGDYNIIIKIIAGNLEDLEEFVREKISPIKGIESVSYQVITRTIKDDHSFPIKEGLLLKAKCIYCYNDIKDYAKIIKLEEQPEGYFCCNSCLTLYKQKYKGRLDVIPK
jgi:Lrp/AsnC family transcriptional regulator, regulator for asnA, asnC and gidA